MLRGIPSFKPMHPLHIHSKNLIGYTRLIENLESIIHLSN